MLFVLRHTGVGALVGYRLWGSLRFMGYQEDSGMIEITRVKDLSTWCVSLEFVEFLGVCCVVSQTEIYIPWPVLRWQRGAAD